MPLVTVVIPAYNAEAFIEETLESIFEQTMKQFEIVVVNDGSTDRTASKVRAFDDQIVLLERENSGGCSTPRNDGIAIAKSDLICVFDADDIMMPSKLERQTKLLIENPDLQFSFTDFADFTGNKTMGPHTLTCHKFRQLLHVGETAQIIEAALAYETLFLENFIGASSIVFRKSLISRIGGFDPSLNSSEDYDFFFRVAREYDMGFIDFIGHRRRLHEQSMSSNVGRMIRRKMSVANKQLELVRTPKEKSNLAILLAESSEDLGQFNSQKADYKAAIAYFAQSIKHRPFRLRPYWKTLKALIKALVRNAPLNTS